jgi:nitroimidazol reductase NimA-like FMN-containing flavoprotein (pyridoxamine 5'-phosphate oxidase superfamily)
MSSPQLRRADRMMPDDCARQFLQRGFSGRLATIGEDGYPYCVPLLYVCMDDQVFVHTTSARGHFRNNIDREQRICFEVDEPDQVFDYGRFECDSGLAYASVILFGRIRVVEERDVKQRFCEMLMQKYGKPDTGRSTPLRSSGSPARNARCPRSNGRRSITPGRRTPGRPIKPTP